MRLIVTRPAEQASPVLAELRALGLDAVALPLIRIVATAEPLPVRRAWQDLPLQALVVFVSANAVAHFFAQRPLTAGQSAVPAGGLPEWPARTLAGSTGPGTTSALRAAGVPAPLIAEPDPRVGRFDSEALWLELQQHDRAPPSWNGQRVLVVRGEDGRDWLAETLRSQGAVPEFVAAYRRDLPRLDDAQRAVLDQSLDQPAHHLWLFSSSEAVHNLEHLRPGAAWQASSAAASHPRIAQAARDAGFGRVVVQSLQPADLQRLLAAAEGT
jgi:uroporphyrinogen-III synthase